MIPNEREGQVDHHGDKPALHDELLQNLIPLSSAEGFRDKSILSKADLGFDVKAVSSFWQNSLKWNDKINHNEF